MRSGITVVLLLIPVTTGAAEPWKRHTIDGSSRGADGVRLADANGDGLPDIVTGWEQGGVIRLYYHPGPQQVSRRWPAVTVGRVRDPEDAVLVDLDGDGALDVVSSCEGKTRTVYFHWSPPDAARRLDESAWSTSPVPATAQAQMWMYAVPAQLDGRHGVDLVVGSKGPRAAISWLEAPQQPRDVQAWKLHPIRAAGWIMSLVMHDMDGDGDQDILFSDRKEARRGVGWLENPGNAVARQQAPWREHPIGGSDHQVMFLALSDWDADGVLDVAVATSGGPLLVFTQQPARQTWTRREVPLPAGCGSGKSVGVGDLDRDGQSELVFTCEQAKGELSGVRWLSPRKTQAGLLWQDHEIGGPEGVKYDRVELLDLDADGDLDVLTCEESDNLGVIWYENPT